MNSHPLFTSAPNSQLHFIPRLPEKKNDNITNITNIHDNSLWLIESHECDKCAHVFSVLQNNCNKEFHLLSLAIAQEKRPAKREKKPNVFNRDVCAHSHLLIELFCVSLGVLLVMCPCFQPIHCEYTHIFSWVCFVQSHHHRLEFYGSIEMEICFKIRETNVFTTSEHFFAWVAEKKLFKAITCNHLPVNRRTVYWLWFDGSRVSGKTVYAYVGKTI